MTRDKIELELRVLNACGVWVDIFRREVEGQACISKTTLNFDDASDCVREIYVHYLLSVTRCRRCYRVCLFVDQLSIDPPLSSSLLDCSAEALTFVSKVDAA